MDVRGGFTFFLYGIAWNFLTGPSPELLRKSGGAGERCIQSVKAVAPYPGE